tara:strand:+ start:323 stop:1369 length:1047 start_codon:yes stop_codon:yes gene_type:complete
MSLLEKLKSKSTIKEASVLSDSKFFNESELAPTPIPIINMALSSRFDGGLSSGLTSIAGESKSFKTMLGLMCVKAYMDKYPDAICLFYDTEFGSPPNYLESQGIDLDRIYHIPVMHIEQLKFDLVRMLDNIERKENVIVFIDSVGNIASKKEVEDAQNEKSVADMTRAKALKSLFRIVTPTLTMKNIPCVVINHTYKSQGLFPVDVVSGGTGVMYSSSTVFIITKSKEKDGKELTGFTFKINIEKSRYVVEKSKFPFKVTFDGGISKWTGLFDLALESGYIKSPKQGWYTRILWDENGEQIEDKNWRKAETDTKEFWNDIFATTDFAEAMHKKYGQGTGKLLQDSEDD